MSTKMKTAVDLLVEMGFKQYEAKIYAALVSRSHRGDRDQSPLRSASEQDL